jgi:PKD repeat protein
MRILTCGASRKLLLYVISFIVRYMSTRALLALMVLVGSLPIPNVVAQSPCRADPGPSVFFLRCDTGFPYVLVSEAPQQGWLDIANNTSVEFRIAGFSALYEPSHDFRFEPGILSPNGSGRGLSFSMLADNSGDGITDTAVVFKNYTTTGSMQTEHPAIDMENITGEPGDMSNGTLRLMVNRTDDLDGIVRLHCGAGANASMLLLPYGAPVLAVAGSDLSTKVGRTVHFNASSSRTTDPAHTSYIWDFDSSDGLGTDATGQNVSYAYPLAGTYNVTLTLKLGMFVSSDTLRVNVSPNIRPVANAGPDVVRARMGIPVSFHGSGEDPDGTVVAYSWSFGDGANATGPNVSHVYIIPGNFTVRLVVKDDDGASVEDSLWVRINYPPTILSVPFSISGNQVSLRTNATDPDAGDTLSYRWDLGDGNISTSPSPAHMYEDSGDYIVICTVFDPWGDNDTYTVDVSINIPPVILSLGSRSTAQPEEKINFIPSVYDPDHDNLTYQWDFGDGGLSTDPTPSHTYSTEGSYLVTLTVSDGHSTVSSTLLIQVATATDENNPAASASGLACLALIGIIVLVVIVYAISRTKTQQPSGPYYPPGGPPGAPYMAQPPGQPYFGGPSGEPYPGFGGPGPMIAPRPPRAPTPGKAPAGVCPRCGSRDLTVFGDGHSKCNNCKKIIYSG